MAGMCQRATLQTLSVVFGMAVVRSAGLRRSRHVGAHAHVAHRSRSVFSPVCGRRLAQGRLLQVKGGSGFSLACYSAQDLSLLRGGRWAASKQ